ncbi:MAG TPA: DUF4040 domain-containing protein [Gammaproteobacteria bacterium]|jgi:multicomponent Na+:H+ antiporter subunit B|nr:DUF4040 domain-containing protein [Gammaproteobacteria bacterium]
MIEHPVYLLLLTLLAVTALAMVRLRNTLAVIMLSGIYSLLVAGLFVMMDAVDVAFTEAAVGAGISTVLMVATLALTTRESRIPTHRPLLPLAVVMLTGGALIWGTLDMPHYGDPEAPVHQHVGIRYLNSYDEIGVPNVVTSVLASYRGFDTLGETAVVFTAAVGVLIILRGWQRRRRRRQAVRERT